MSSEMKHLSYALVPKMQETLLQNTKDKRPEEVLRHYDYEANDLKGSNALNSLYSNLSEWKTKEVFPMNQIAKGDKCIYSSHCEKELKAENEKTNQQPACKDQKPANNSSKMTNKTIITVAGVNGTGEGHHSSQTSANNSNEKTPIYDITNYPSSSSSFCQKSQQCTAQSKPNRPKTPTTESSTTDTTTTSTTAVPVKIKSGQEDPAVAISGAETAPKQSPQHQRVIIKRTVGNDRPKWLTRQSPASTGGYKSQPAPPMKDASPPPPPILVYKEPSSELKSLLNKKCIRVGPVNEKPSRSRDGGLVLTGGGLAIGGLRPPNKSSSVETRSSNAGPRRLSGSVNELDRAVFGVGPSSAASGPFRMSEFKKEFKRFGASPTAANSITGSTELLSHSFSKSINTLDLLGTSLVGRHLVNMNTHHGSLTTTTSDQLSTTTPPSTSGSGRLFANTLTTSANDKTSNTSFSHNDLRTIPLAPDNSANYFPHQQQRQSLERLLKQKNKAYIRMKNQETQMSQTLPQLNNSDSLNNSDEEAAAKMRPASIESSSSHQPASSSFFLHEKLKASKRPSSTSNERAVPGSKTSDSSIKTGVKQEEFSERSNMTNVSGKDEPIKRLNDSGIRKESRVLSLSSSFLSSSNESNQDKIKYQQMISQQEAVGALVSPTRTESSLRRHAKTSQTPPKQQQQSSPNTYFPISSFSSCDLASNQNDLFNSSLKGDIKYPLASPTAQKNLTKIHGLRRYSPISKTSPSPTSGGGRASIEPPSSASPVPVATTTSASPAASATTRRSSTPKTMITSTMTDDPSSVTGPMSGKTTSWLLNYSSYTATTIGSTIKPPNDLSNVYRNRMNRSNQGGRQNVPVNLNLSVPSSVPKEGRKVKTFFKTGPAGNVMNKYSDQALHPNQEDMDIQSEKQSKNMYSVCDSIKGLHSYGISSEPIKSIMNAITLSSLDTLNDIDSESSSSSSDSEERHLARSDNDTAAVSRGHGPLSMSVPGRVTSSDEDYHEVLRRHGHYHRHHHMDDGDDLAAPAHDDRRNYHHHHHQQHYHPRDYQASNHRSRRRKHHSQHHHTSNVKSSTPLPLGPHFVEPSAQQQKAIQHLLLEQDWSYSQNSNNTATMSNNNNPGQANSLLCGAGSSTTTSDSTQKIVNEIVRKLKPYIIKCVKKEVRNCFDKYQHRKEVLAVGPSATTHSKTSKYTDNSLTKIGDF